MRIDLLVRARSILTLEPGRPAVSAVGVQAGRIVGFDEELDGCRPDRVEDFGDAVVVPGFIDAHCHTAWWGLGLGDLDVSTAGSLEELYRMLARAAADLEDDPEAWIKGTGFDHEHLGGLPDIARLDEITAGRPLYLRHVSGHAAITNTATLRLAGALEPDFADPVGGVVVRAASGRPTGLVEEAAQGLVQQLLLPYSLDALVEALEAATARYAARGITSFADAGIGGGWIGHSPVEARAYQLARRSGRLHARAQLMPTLDVLHPLLGHGNDFGTEGGRGLDLGIGFGLGDDRLSLGHVKAFMDGSLLGGTAAVTESFCRHPHGTGYLLDSPESYRERVLAVARAGWPVALHAIGDAAIDLALELIEECHRERGHAAAPDRIEHFGIARPDQVIRAGRLGIAVTPQAGFIGPLGDQFAAQVGPDREPWLYRGRSLVEAGAILAGSSDLPVADNDILRGMQAAVDRRTAGGRTLGDPGERLDREQALRAYTIGAAQAMGQATEKGTLARGKLADMAVLSESPLTAERITSARVIATICGGALSHDARGGAAEVA